MSDPKQLAHDLDIAVGDVCFQISPAGDYEDQSHFLATMQPMFDAAERRNNVAFDALVVDTTMAISLDGQNRELYRATATAGAR